MITHSHQSQTTIQPQINELKDKIINFFKENNTTPTSFKFSPNPKDLKQITEFLKKLYQAYNLYIRA